MAAPDSLPDLFGIAVGRAPCRYALLQADKPPVGQPSTFANSAAGFAVLAGKLQRRAVCAAQVRVGLEATGLYWANLYYYLQAQGYTGVWLMRCSRALPHYHARLRILPI